MCISSHVESVVEGVFLKEEKVKQEVLDGPQASSYEELNSAHEHGKLWCI
jgi:hypothetical protein